MVDLGGLFRGLATLSHFDLFAQRVDAFGGDQLLRRQTSDDLQPVAVLALRFESTAYSVDDPVSKQAKEEMSIGAAPLCQAQSCQITSRAYPLLGACPPEFNLQFPSYETKD